MLIRTRETKNRPRIWLVATGVRHTSVSQNQQKSPLWQHPLHTVYPHGRARKQFPFSGEFCVLDRFRYDTISRDVPSSHSNGHARPPR